MPRARISKNGAIQVAMPNYDVDTAGPTEMIIDSNYSMVRVFMKGTVPLVRNAYIPPSGRTNDWYGARISFGKTMVSPPLVYVSFNYIDTSSTIHLPMWCDVITPAVQVTGKYGIVPHQYIEVTKTDLTIRAVIGWDDDAGAPRRQWRSHYVGSANYQIMENLVS